MINISQQWRYQKTKTIYDLKESKNDEVHKIKFGPLQNAWDLGIALCPLHHDTQIPSNAFDFSIQFNYRAQLRVHLSVGVGA